VVLDWLKVPPVNGWLDAKTLPPAPRLERRFAQLLYPDQSAPRRDVDLDRRGSSAQATCTSSRAITPSSGASSSVTSRSADRRSGRACSTAEISDPASLRRIVHR